MTKETLTYILVGALSLTAGVAVGMIIQKKSAEKKFEQELDSIKSYYKTRDDKRKAAIRDEFLKKLNHEIAEGMASNLGYGSDKSATKVEADKQNAPFPGGYEANSEQPSTGTDEYPESHGGGTKPSGKKSPQRRPKRDGAESKAQRHFPTGRPKDRLVPEEEWDEAEGFDGAYPAELDDPDFEVGGPYLIKKSQYESGTNTKVQLTYYDVDDILADETNKPFPELGIAGDCLWRLDDHPTIHVRNQEKGLDMEITLCAKPYAEVLAGIRERKTKRVSRMKDDD